MGAASSLSSGSSGAPKSTSMTLCSSALGNGGAGAQAAKLPDTNTVVVLGGSASCSISYTGTSLVKDLNYFSMKLSTSGGGPLPTIEGHSLTGLSGRRAVVLGGLMVGRRSSGERARNSCAKGYEGNSRKSTKPFARRFTPHPTP